MLTVLPARLDQAVAWETTGLGSRHFPPVLAMRLGAVSYLNTKPLVEGLRRDAAEYELVFDLPSRLADGLRAGELDVALVPSVEVLQHPEYEVVSDACIACRGEVWSVKLLSRVPLDEVRTLAVDEGSRTSVVLAQILLADHRAEPPQLQPLSIGERWQACRADAVVIIGDRAMRAHDAQFPVQRDLGQWWMERWKRPFVFALWAGRPGIDAGRCAAVLSAARDRGLAQLPEIAQREAERYGLSVSECLNYFEQHLHFHLGEPERSGLKLFGKLASEARVASGSQPIGIDGH